jgi:hypothetical protein
VRFLSSLIAIAFFTVACGADGSDVVGDDLALAQQEIARLEALLAEQPEAVGGEDDDSDLEENESDWPPVYDSRDMNTMLQWSEGPCGVFRLNGTRILELVPILDEDGYLDWENYRQPWEWVDIGIDYLELVPETEPYYGAQLLQRPPSLGLVGKVLPDRNSFFWLQWSWERRTVQLPSDIELDYDDNVLGANQISVAGVFGPNENCEWDWIPIHWSEGDWHYTFVMNASVFIVYEDRPEGSFGVELYGNPWFEDFTWKDHSCPFETRYATAEYDPALHAFLTTCGTKKYGTR